MSRLALQGNRAQWSNDYDDAGPTYDEGFSAHTGRHGIELVVIARDIVTAGNTSAASIPLALDALRASGKAASGDLAVLVGYGAGLTYAAMVARIP